MTKYLQVLSIFNLVPELASNNLKTEFIINEISAEWHTWKKKAMQSNKNNNNKFPLDVE